MPGQQKSAQLRTRTNRGGKVLIERSYASLLPPASDEATTFHDRQKGEGGGRFARRGWPGVPAISFLFMFPLWAYVYLRCGRFWKKKIFPFHPHRSAFGARRVVFFGGPFSRVWREERPLEGFRVRAREGLGIWALREDWCFRSSLVFA